MGQVGAKGLPLSLAVAMKVLGISTAATNKTNPHHSLASQLCSGHLLWFFFLFVVSTMPWSRPHHSLAAPPRAAHELGFSQLSSPSWAIENKQECFVGWLGDKESVSEETKAAASGFTSVPSPTIPAPSLCPPTSAFPVS